MVLCVVKTLCENNRTPLVHLCNENENESLLVTPWHPVRFQGKWQFPAYIAPTTVRDCDAVYSFVLADSPHEEAEAVGFANAAATAATAITAASAATTVEHKMVIGGMECVALGHRYTDDEAVRHPYFGTREVVQDLRQMQGWEIGLVCFDHGCMVRSNVGTGIGIGTSSGSGSGLLTSFDASRVIIA